MLEPFGTLIFLVTLWLAFKTVVELLDDNGERMLAALLGRTARTGFHTAKIPVRVSRRRAALQPARVVRAQWRAAA